MKENLCTLNKLRRKLQAGLRLVLPALSNTNQHGRKPQNTLTYKKKKRKTNSNSKQISSENLISNEPKEKPSANAEFVPVIRPGYVHGTKVADIHSKRGLEKWKPATILATQLSNLIGKETFHSICNSKDSAKQTITTPNHAVHREDI